jgi:hypothetical protein
MTDHNHFPVRGGAAWPGTNTLSGKLDDGSGQLTLNSKNVMINTADTLAKRKGFVRGLDERFSGPVCGLHRYTSECGIEYLLVADETGIFVRTPFAVPFFTTSDAYPNDDFPGTTNTPNMTWWRDPSIGYKHTNGILRIKAGQPNPLVWFKDATSTSYQLIVDFVIDESESTGGVKIFLKSSSDSGMSGSLFLDIAISGTNLIGTINFRNVVDSAVATGTVVRTRTGRAFVRYDASTRRVSAEVFTSGNPLELEATLTAVQDAELGQQSMLQIVGSGVTGIDTISGAPL